MYRTYSDPANAIDVCRRGPPSRPLPNLHRIFDPRRSGDPFPPSGQRSGGISRLWLPGTMRIPPRSGSRVSDSQNATFSDSRDADAPFPYGAAPSDAIRRSSYLLFRAAPAVVDQVRNIVLDVPAQMSHISGKVRGRSSNSRNASSSTMVLICSPSDRGPSPCFSRSRASTRSPASSSRSSWPWSSAFSTIRKPC